MGLKENRTDMPHAYVEFADGTTIAVPLTEHNYTHVAKVHVTTAAGETVDVCRVTIRRHPAPVAMIARDDRQPALVK